jgi:hypothetical protein
MRDDPSPATQQSQEVFLTGQHRVVVAGGLGLVRQKPLELEVAAGAEIPLALHDSDGGPALRTGELDGGKALLAGIGVHAL